ncbi:TolC family protein [Sphingobacterium corticis]|uniref:TolC family protein n=1 Tax=Sphingobacterium corticis TaxID=1812823 RepID=A0ABW5NE75_9SPHI
MKLFYVFLCSALLFLPPARAQEFSLQQLEAAFLENNYLLIASRFQIDQADAEIIQEKLWDNPNLSISEVNLWSNRTSEQFARLLGNYGRTQQFAIELEQLIETAGKRKKRVAIRTLEKQSAALDYEELMRELRKDLRDAYFEVYVLNQELTHLQQSLSMFGTLKSTYRKQAEAQNISRADWLRVQAELVTLEKEQLDLETELLEALQVLRTLTNNSSLQATDFTFQDVPNHLQKNLPATMRALAMENNISIKRQENDVMMADKSLELELANSKPDLTFQVNYDRGGNIMQDFFGLGVSMDLPILNRNKGNIKVAQFQIKEEQAKRSAVQSSLENKISSLAGQIGKYRQTLQQWSDHDSEGERQMLENYQKNMLNRQITLLEFIDFTQAWRASYQAMLATQKNFLNTYEELQLLVGNDF